MNIIKKKLFKKIPKSEEYIASIGMGTWLTFDIGYNTKKLKQRTEILKLFLIQEDKLLTHHQCMDLLKKLLVNL